MIPGAGPAQPHEVLHLSARSRILRDAQHGLVKQVRGRALTPQRLRALIHEAQLSALAGADTVRATGALLTIDGLPSLELLDVGGRPLPAWQEAEAPDLARRLRVGAALARALGRLHDVGITHRDLKPEHVLVLDDDDVRLIDLASATLDARGWQEPVHPRDLPDTLAYLAPERTGRIDRSHDERADLYALGVVLHELVTGERPFPDADPLALLQARLARRPPRADAATPALPAAIGDLIESLLARQQEARPQSAHEVARRLEEPGETVAPDAPAPRFSLPMRVYGRHDERRRLLAASERARLGESTFMVLSGSYGSGKRVLVSSVFSRTKSSSFDVLTVRFGRDDESGSASPLLDSMAPLLRRLSRSEDGAGRLERLAEQLGDQRSVLHRDLPVLADLGDLAASPSLPPQETERRFELASLDLLRGLAGPDHPLLMILEDCERLDPVSARLCRLATSPAGVPHLLVLGTTTDERAARRTLGMQDPADGDGPEFMPVSALHPRDTAEMIADTLYRDVADVDALAARVHRVARGNPHAVHQVLERLRVHGTLAWDASANHWRWQTADLARDRTLNDQSQALNSVELLSSETRHCLSAAAVVGEQFDLPTLARALDRPLADVARTLREATRAEVLTPAATTDAGYVRAARRMPAVGDLAALEARAEALRLRFVQPAVHRAVYGALPETARARLHESAGRQLIRAAADDGARFREGVGQLDLAQRGSVLDASALQELALLNQRAGHSALAEGRPQSAFRFLRTGLALLGAGAWVDTPDLAAELSLDAMEAATLCADSGQVERLGRSALAHSLPPGAHVRVARHLVRMLFGSGQDAEALEVAQRALARVEMAPTSSTRRPLLWLAARLLLSGRSLARRMKDAEHAPAPVVDRDDPRADGVALLMDLAQGQFYGDPRALLAILLRLVEATRRNPHLPEAPFALTCVAAACAMLGLRDDLLRYTPVITRALARPDLDLRAGLRARLLRDAYISPWLFTPSRFMGDLLDLHAATRGIGDLETASYAALGYASTEALIGADLGRALEHAEALAGDLAMLHSGPGHRALVAHVLFLQAVCGDTDGPVADLEARLTATDPSRTGFEEAFLGLLLAWHRLLAGDAAGALETLERDAVAGMDASPGLAGTQFHLIRALAALDVARPAARSERRRLVALARRSRRRLETWIAHGLGYLRQRVHLIEAEEAALKGRDLHALDAYEQSIRAARTHGFAFDEGLAWERAGRFCRRTHRHEVASRFLDGALDVWNRTGATLCARRLRVEEAGTEGPPPPVGPQREDDPMRLLASAIAIGSEVRLDALVATLVERVLSGSGAERAALVLRDGDQLELVAVADAQASAVVHLGERPLTSCADEVPVALIQRVARSGEPWVTDDAAAEDTMARDPYVSRRRPRSMAALPMRVGDRDLGVLYVEHRERFAAFPPRRLEILRLLTTQAASSLETARLHEELARARDEYRDLFANAAEGLFRVGLDGRLIVANDALALALGYSSAEDLMGDVTHLPRDIAAEPEHAGALIDAIRRDSVLTNVEFQALTRDGTLVWVEVSARVVRDSEGQARTIEGSMVDVTARRERQQAEQAREVAEAATRAKSHFLASMSHEIRTPMNAIQGFAELALERDPEPRVREYLGTIREAARSLLDIVNDVLDLSRIEAGRVELARAEIDPPALLKSLETLFETRARHKGLILEIDGADAVSAALPADRALAGDPGRLRQVLVNLVDNALKFTDRGRVAVNVVLAGRDPDAARLAFEVIDTGPGIPEDQRKRLFEPFEQLEAGSTRRFTGTGLGLSISRQLVDLMGGSLTVAGNPSGGSVFAFDVHLALVPREQLARPARTRLPSRALAGRELLLAEDNRINQQLALEFLESAGARVHVTETGHGVLAQIEEHDFDAVLMDLHMPGLDGIEACRRLRALPAGRDLPVIAVTADAVGDGPSRARDAGFDDFVLKPIDRATLVGTLLRHLPARPEPTDDAEAIPRSRPQVPRVRGLDVARALHNHDGNATLLLALLGEFQTHYGDAGPRLRMLLAGDRAEAAARLAHNLHGVAGSFGAEAVRIAAGDLERAIEDGETLLDARLVRLEQALGEALVGAADLRASGIEVSQDSIHEKRGSDGTE